jgi:16S rRNA U1498 N3-methylase RsmE
MIATEGIIETRKKQRELDLSHEDWQVIRLQKEIRVLITSLKIKHLTKILQKCYKLPEGD